MTDERKVTITFEEDDEGVLSVKTWVKGEMYVEQIIAAFMWSAVCLLRKNDYEDEEIPDVVREALREAMLARSEKLPESARPEGE